MSNPQYMTTDLFREVNSGISPEYINYISSFLGEEKIGIAKAVEAAIPTLLTNLAEKALQNFPVGAIVNKLAETGLGEQAVDLFKGDQHALSKASGLVTELFGTRSGVTASLISSYAGIKPSSATTVLAAVAPLAIAAVGKRAGSAGLDDEGINSLLISESKTFRDMIPEGLYINEKIDNKMQEVITTREQEKTSTGLPIWALPLLLIVSGAMLILYFTGKTKLAEPEVAAKPVTTEVAPVKKESLQVELPNGITLNAFRGGIEDQLVSFLKDSNAVAGKDVWFDFDNLNFALGTAEISPESQMQVDNIAAILKAFPKAKIKIGGYTDKTGDESSNLTLSKNRAEAVRSALVAAGVGAQVTDAEGYGSQFAKIPAEAPESARIADRRVSVSIREK